MKTGNTPHRPGPDLRDRAASMEPGHEDREYARTGAAHGPAQPASMEPGHEDREYLTGVLPGVLDVVASMEPGHEDREYTPQASDATRATIRLNGARS